MKLVLIGKATAGVQSVVDVLTPAAGLTAEETFPAEILEIAVAAPDGVDRGWTTTDGGKTFAAPPEAAVDLSAYAKARRDATEAQGITVNGVAIASDPDSQTRVANAYSGMQVTGATSIRFKATSGFIVLTLDQVKAVGSALFAHTQACFDAEDQVDAALSASPPTITTTAQIDAAFAAVRSAF